MLVIFLQLSASTISSVLGKDDDDDNDNEQYDDPRQREKNCLILSYCRFIVMLYNSESQSIE